MHKPTLVGAGALVAAVGIAVPTLAQSGSPTTVSGSAKITPTKVGTKKKPKGVKLTVKVHWETTGDVDHPIIQSGDAWFPKGSLYQGDKYPKCSEETLSRSGPSACPDGSIMGTGTGDANADTVITRPKITIVNGGKSKVFLYTVLDNPARVQAPVPGTISKPGGKWAYKLHLEVPKQLQIVAGVPITLNNLTLTAGSSSKKWLATTSCPDNSKFPYQVKPDYSTGGSGQFNGTTPCKKG